MSFFRFFSDNMSFFSESLGLNGYLLLNEIQKNLCLDCLSLDLYRYTRWKRKSVGLPQFGVVSDLYS